MMRYVLNAYGINDDASVTPYGSGLINHTWKIVTGGREYILQQVNDKVFKVPENIAHNITLIADYLRQQHPDYCFAAPIRSSKGTGMIYLKDKGCFRMFPFMTGSHSKDVVQTSKQAYEAAAQFGRFTRLLSGIDVSELKVTIPDFHNLNLRYVQFNNALQNGSNKRLHESKELIEQLARHSDIVRAYDRLKLSPGFKLRVTHHDAKISNVLFDSNDKGICVIDLDTVMPGYFISDVGDMIRTYVSPVSEEEPDFRQIVVREEFYNAIVQGYGKEMKEELTQEERDHFFYAGKFMIYMQALRFLTDHLNNDIYYGTKYEGQNFVRAKNQAVLLEKLIEKERAFTGRQPGEVGA
jgi:Ser/Thr protein kinase RdoA (MazF antagonist)